MAKIKNAKFIKSVADAKAYDGFSLPEIAVVGRSNVGKSSFINLLANNKKLAKTSSTPGRTRLINFFEFEMKDDSVEKKLMLVDLPGYGYAKANHGEQNRWKTMIEGYFEKTNNLKSVVLLVDIRHEPTIQDLQMFDYLFKMNIDITVVATKADKVSKAEANRNKLKIASVFKIGAGNVFVTSSEKAIGKQDIVDRLWQFVKGEQYEDLGD